MKKVTIGIKPTSRPPAPSADSWVENRVEEESMKRLTIDITESLHRKIKSSCAMRGTKIADEVRELLLQKYGND
jgi:DNA polymerase III delta subunit